MNGAIRLARLRGAKEAERILRILEVRESIASTQNRVDVFDALAWLDVRVVFKPLTSVLGLYIRGEFPGALINTNRPLSVQRFTAAHELGHAVMGHDPSLDSQDVLRRAAQSKEAPAISGFASYLQEIEADSFASSFLLPRWLVVRHARTQEWSRSHLKNPDIVYQLALRCGASYQATVWALARDQFIDANSRMDLLSVQPKVVKSRARGDFLEADSRTDAWLIGDKDSSVLIPISVGDTITIELEQAASAGYLWLPTTEQMDTLVNIGEKTNIDTDGVGSPSMRRLVYRADKSGEESLAFVHQRPWETEAERALSLDVVVSEPEKGLSRANRARMASSAKQKTT